MPRSLSSGCWASLSVLASVIRPKRRGSQSSPGCRLFVERHGRAWPARVGRLGSADSQTVYAPRHPQVNQHRVTAVEPADDVIWPADRCHDGPTARLLLEVWGIGTRRSRRRTNDIGQDLLAEKAAQTAADGFNFGKLRHARIIGCCVPSGEAIGGLLARGQATAESGSKERERGEQAHRAGDV